MLWHPAGSQSGTMPVFRRIVCNLAHHVRQAVGGTVWIGAGGSSRCPQALARRQPAGCPRNAGGRGKVKF
ncbi:MAG: hypothetical protein KME26_33345 [Oscillatoria princeps RMCB-10]|nr:hypothetical protein [Oscillatoria princeps RMCB-10]